MGQSNGAFRFLLFVLAIIVTGAATTMGIRLGFGLLVLFVVAGLSIFVAFISLMVRPGVRSERARSHLRAADPGFHSYVMTPTEMYPGYCWQCGRRVKPDSVVCLRCGAAQTQRHAPAPVQESEPAPWDVSMPRLSGGLTRWDSSPGTPVPWGSPPPPSPQGGRSQQPEPRQPVPPAQPNQRVAPQYRPGAPPPWMPQRQPTPAAPPRKRRRGRG